MLTKSLGFYWFAHFCLWNISATRFLPHAIYMLLAGSGNYTKLPNTHLLTHTSKYTHIHTHPWPHPHTHTNTQTPKHATTHYEFMSLCCIFKTDKSAKIVFVDFYQLLFQANKLSFIIWNFWFRWLFFPISWSSRPR